MEEDSLLKKETDEPLFKLFGLTDENVDKMKRTIKVQEQRINGLKKALARCENGSNNSKKIMAKISRVEQKMNNTKKYLRKCY